MKKIAVDTVKNFVKVCDTSEHVGTHTFAMGEWSMTMECKLELTLYEQSVFINRVLSGCFDELGNYRPEYFEPMMHATMIQMCTNLPAVSLRGERDAEGGQLIDLKFMDSLYMMIGLENTFPTYPAFYDRMEKLCREAVAWRKERILASEKSESFDSIVHAVNDVAQAVIDKVNSMDLDALTEYAGALSKATDGLNDGGILNGLLEMHKEGKLVELPKA